jgi:PAS domain S-box-containing protein
MEERVPVEFEEYYPPFDLWTQVRCDPTPDGGLAVFFTDTTAQKKIIQQAEAEKQKFEAIFVDSPACVALLRGPELIYEKANSRYRALMGFRELIGKPVLEAVPELRQQEFPALMKRVFETGEPYHGKEKLARIIRIAGGEPEDFYFDFTYSRVLDGSGNPYGIFIHAMDVTDNVVARQKIETLADELNEALRARDDFLSIASHELKTPLTSLKLRVQLHRKAITLALPKATSLPQIESTVAQTERQVTRLTRLVDDMLDVSRIQSGKLSINKQRFDICELMAEVIERMRSQFEAAKIHVPEFVACAEIFGDWDRMRLEQVLINLLTNAIRYGDGKRIQVGVNSSAGRVALFVRDQGIGIREEMQSIIFNRFERAVGASEISGLGLGLFITRQIVVAHGGTIRVDSEFGKGSTFWVELPQFGNFVENAATG